MPTFTEPTWTTPEEAITPTPSVLLRQVSPFELHGIIVRMLQYHFYDPNNIVNEKLKGYTWEASDITTHILIKPDLERNPQVKGKPSIFVSREDTTGDHAGILRGISIGNPTQQLNDPNYTRLFSGNFVLSCEGLTFGEAESIAWEAADRIVKFSPDLVTDYGVDVFDIKGIGKTVLKTEDRSTAMFVTPVILYWQKLYAWRLVSAEPY
jgi:hypothetical protein